MVQTQKETRCLIKVRLILNSQANKIKMGIRFNSRSIELSRSNQVRRASEQRDRGGGIHRRRSCPLF